MAKLTSPVDFPSSILLFRNSWVSARAWAFEAGVVITGNSGAIWCFIAKRDK